MTPDELRTAQNKVSAPVVGVALGLLRALAVGPLTLDQLARLVAVLFPPVSAARARSEALAAAYYASLNPAGTAPRVPSPEYAPAMLASTIRRFAGSGLEAPETKPRAAVLGAAAVGRHVEQAGREYVAKAASSDGVRCARYDPYGETCAFCRLLISRGPVYLSEATGAFQSHPLCTCVPVPVHGDDWPGREQYEEADALYRRATAGTSGRESIRAFRRAVEGAAA